MPSARHIASRLTEALKRDAHRTWESGAGFIAISRWTGAIAGIARRILLARILGAENIGHIAVVSAVMSLLRLPAGAGIFPVVTKLVAENTGDHHAQKQVIGTALRIAATASALVIVVIWGILSFTNLIHDPIARRLLYVLAVFVPILMFSGVLRCSLMGQRRMKSVALLDMTVVLSGGVATVAMAFLWALRGWFASQMIVAVFGFGLFAWFVRSIMSIRWNRQIADKIRVIGGFSFLSQMLGMLMLQFDTLTVSGILKDPALTGIYNTAALGVQQLLLVPGSILVVVFPFVAQNRDDMGRLRRRYRELFQKLFLLTVGLSAVSWIVCPWIFPVFGPEFSASTAPFRVLIFGLIARSLYILDNTYLEALGRTDVLFAGGALTTAIMIVLNLTMIPRFGVMGAAWAMTVSTFVGLFIRQVLVRYFIFHKQAIR